MTKKILILDLDETLIFAENVKNHDHYNLIFNLDDKKTYYTMYRPHLNTFVEYIKDKFEIYIWTSSDEDYASAICEQIFQEIPYTLLSNKFSDTNRHYAHHFFDELSSFPQLAKIVRAYRFWGKELPFFEYHKPIKIKPMKKFLKKFKKNIKDIVIVDNDPYKFYNYYGNFWSIKEFEGQNNDVSLKNLISILDHLKDQEDVRVRKQDLMMQYPI